MDIYSWIFLGGLGATLLLGYIFGFGKILKFCTSGVIGFAISVWVCITFGGMIASIDAVAQLIVRGNEYFGGYAQLLAKINLATIIYYIALFVIVQILRKIIIAVIAAVFEPKDKSTGIGKARNIVNRVLGCVFFGAFWILIVWVALAVINLLSDVDAVGGWLNNIQVSDGAKLIFGIWKINPISFKDLLGMADSLPAIGG